MKYESFRSTASGPSGHTEQLIIKFLEKNKIPMKNLKALHSEKIPCPNCTSTLIQKLNTNTKVTWDFDDADKNTRIAYIKSL